MLYKWQSFEFKLIRSSFGTRSASVDKDTIKGLEEIYVANKNVSLVEKCLNDKSWEPAKLANLQS